VHLPLADFGDGRQRATELQAYARTAQELGYTTLAANDHLLWRRPWLDGPTALASVAAAAGEMTLATTVALPVVRHPIVAKMLTTLAVLSRAPSLVDHCAEALSNYAAAGAGGLAVARARRHPSARALHERSVPAVRLEPTEFERR
jgi:Luciferase-like monooxygenase